MDNPLFLENKFSTELLPPSEKVENVDSRTEKKKLEENNHKLEETFDFTSDIIDLLLCVENDEYARQNIESIMDQWDEMNILNEDGSTSSMNADASIQLKSKNLPSIQSEKISPASSGSKIAVSTTDKVNLVEKNIVNPFNFSSPSIVSPSYSCTERNCFSSSNTLSSSNVTIISSLPTQSIVPKSSLSDDSLDDRIKALFCIMCNRNYEQIMKTGRIKKMASKPYPCPFCRGNYFHKLSASIHMKVHMEEEALKCRVCVEQEDTKCDSVVEKKRSRRDSFICSICSSSFGSLIELEKHASVHKNTILKLDRKVSRSRFKKAWCCICPEKSRDSGNKLRSCHKCVTSNVARPATNYKCKICGEKFVEKSNLNCHYLRHSVNVKTAVDQIPRMNYNALDHNYVKPAADMIGEEMIDENENVKIYTKTMTVPSIQSRSLADSGQSMEHNSDDVDQIADFRSNKKGSKKDSSINFYPTHKSQLNFIATNSASNEQSLSFLQCTATMTEHSFHASSAITNSQGNERSNKTDAWDCQNYNSSDSILLHQGTDVAQNSGLREMLCSSTENFSTHDAGALMSNDIDTIFQQFFNSHNDEKMLPKDGFCSSTDNSFQNHWAHPSPFIGKGSDTGPNFIELRSNNLAQEPSFDQSSTGLSICANTTVLQTSLLLTQTQNQSKSVGDVKNVLNEGTIPPVPISLKSTAIASFPNELVVPNVTTLTPPTKSYLVVYVLPSNSQTNANSLVTKLSQQKTVLSSCNINKSTGPLLNDTRTAYLVPITDNQINFVAPKPPPTMQNIVAQKYSNDDQYIVISNGIVNSTQFVSRIKNNGKKIVDRNYDYLQKDHIILSSVNQGMPQKNDLSPTSADCSQRNILQIAYDDACKPIENLIPKNDYVSSSNGSRVLAKNAANIATTSKTISSNHRSSKQVLNTKTSLADDITTTENNGVKYIQIPVDISLTEGLGTFQYFNNAKADIGNEIKPSEKCICEVCHKCFVSTEYLSHLKTHNKTVYKCTYCQKIFIEQSTLLQHMQTHSQLQVFNCKLCQKSFTNVILYRLHLLVHKGLLFICVSCVKLFNKKEDYENHLKQHNSNDLICNVCKRNFPNAVNASKVFQQFTCIECISSPEKLQDFTPRLLKEKTVNSVTTNMVTQPALINEFMLEHNKPHVIHEDICFQCPYCDQICMGGVSFKRHKQNHLKHQITCFICCQNFAKFSFLKNHLYTHTFQRIFRCEFCANVFSDKKIYQNHTHENFKPFPCVFCNEFFISRNELTLHSMSHSTNSEIICNYCNARIAPADCLTHKITHAGEEIVECENCNENFVSLSTLIEHAKIHNLQCSNSKKMLSDKESLTFHYQNCEQNKNILNCIYCNEKFDKFNDLLGHSIKLHPGKELKCYKCSCCNQFFVEEIQWSNQGIHSDKKGFLISYILKQFDDHSYSLEREVKDT